MNIAIVNDEKVELETAETFLRVYIKKFLPERKSEINIEIFQRTEDFFQIFSAGLYNFVIIGAHMEEVANFIRASGDYDAKILLFKFNDNSGGGGIYEYCTR